MESSLDVRVGQALEHQPHHAQKDPALARRRAELCSVSPWPPGLRLGGGVGVEAAARTQAHHEADGQML